jgi:hypothetical protein
VNRKCAVSKWVAAGLLIVISGALSAQDWSELGEAEQAVLAPWEPQWNELSQDRRQRLLEGADRWQDMTPEKRAQVRSRLQAWEAMTPEERARIRARMERFRNMSEAQRDRVREGMRRLQELPPGQRRELRRRWEQMDADERRAFLSGLALGERMNRGAWTAALSAEQRKALRELSDGLDRVQRLAVLAKLRNMAGDDQRVDYARRLIEAGPDERAEMIEGAESELRQRRDRR